MHRCIKVLLTLALSLTILSAILLCFSIPRQPEHTQTQPFYGLGSLTYSPFPSRIKIHRYYYNRISVTTIGADDEDDDFNKFNITVCSTVCPLIMSDHFLSVTDYRLNDSHHSNYYVNLRNLSSPNGSGTTDAQYFMLYLLEGSSLTFIITRLAPWTDVHVCITDSVDVCREVYINNNITNSLQEVCQEVLSFNKTSSDHTETFTVRSTSYYCAVWILQDDNQSLYYTVNITRRSYSVMNLSTGRPPSPAPQCQTHQKQTVTQFFDLRPHIAYKMPDPVCIAIRIIGNQLKNNITLVSTVVSSKVDNITFVFGVLFATISIVTFFISVLVMVCSVAYKKICGITTGNIII
jgi:hypothetical protein